MSIPGDFRVQASAETRADYRVAGAQLARRWCGEDRAGDATFVCAAFLARAKERMYATATLRLYREQVLAYVESLGAAPAYLVAIRTLNVGALGAARGRTSALKLQKISQLDINALLSHLRRDDSSVISRQAGDLFEASLMFGLRPVEWRSAVLEVFDIGWSGDVVGGVEGAMPTHRLRVANAKHNLIRGNGEFRDIYATLSVAQASLIVRCIEAAQSNGRAWRTWYKQLANALYYGGHSLWPRRKRVPCFYTARHQCIADAKASGGEPRALAAIFGHASDWTARKHYSKRQNGDKNRCMLRASLSCVELVRNQSLTTVVSAQEALKQHAPQR